MDEYEERFFRNKVSDCLAQTEKIFDKNLHIFDETVPHTINEKYRVVEGMTNLSILSFMNCFRKLGVSDTHLLTLSQWHGTANVYLGIEVINQCEYIKEVRREEDSSVSHVTEATLGAATFSITSKVVNMITEHVFEYKSQIRLFLHRGKGSSDVIELQNRSSTQEITQSSKVAPYVHKSLKSFDVNISWIVAQYTPRTNSVGFVINGSHRKCFTPINNEDVAAAVKAFAELRRWASAANIYIHQHIFEVYRRHSNEKAVFCSSDGLFLPVFPAVWKNKNAADDTRVSNVFKKDDDVFAALTQEHVRSLDSVLIDRVAEIYNASDDARVLYSRTEAGIVLLLTHTTDLDLHFTRCLAFVEYTIRKQLITAVGRSLTARDFEKCYAHHINKLMPAAVAPKPLSFSVRRSSQHSSEGSFSIEEYGADSGIHEPIRTFSAQFVSSASETKPMQFPLNSSTVVSFSGERYVHGWLMHAFSVNDKGSSSSSVPDVRICLRAKQFSNFVVLLGNIASATVFQPQHAFIVQNSDSLSIPLELETIPTAKQFKKAIVSISEAQQRFAKAYRAMQLQSTLFGVLVIQIKPNLERIMQIPRSILTKEIQLTQHLMKLLLKYQIPSDQLAYDLITDSNTSSSSSSSSAVAVAGAQQQLPRSLAVVKANVATMLAMIAQCEEEKVKEARQKAEYERQANLLDLSDDSRSSGSNRSICLATDRVDEGHTQLYPAVETQGRRSIVTRVWDSLFGCSADAVNDVLSMPASNSWGADRSCDDYENECEECEDGGGGGGPSTPRNSLRSAASAGEGANFDNKRSSSPLALAMAPPVQQAVAAPESHQQSEGPQQPAQKPSSGEHDKGEQMSSSSSAGAAGAVDVTTFPDELDSRFEAMDVHNAVRATTIRISGPIKKEEQKSLLSNRVEKVLEGADLDSEREATLGLLDALSKSGGLVLDHTALHVVIAATHCFDANLMDSLVKENINPIERVDRSSLLMASVIYQQPMQNLIEAEQRDAVLTHSPSLFIEG